MFAGASHKYCAVFLMSGNNATARPLLFSYGGGHALIIIAIARELAAQGLEFDLMGFTTAHAAFTRAGFDALDVTAMLSDDVAPDIRARGTELAPSSDHPDITQEQTDAYFILGLEDLCLRHGISEAERLVGQFGRKAFEPEFGFRRFLSAIKPSCVVTTTSPRAELAGIKAAKALSIPSIAVGDMYLIAEQDWILSGIYADHLVVMSDDVADMLGASGRLKSKIHVLGNPAFDELAPSPLDDARRTHLRSKLNVGDRSCILWPLGGAPDLVEGRRLLTAPQAAACLEEICAADRGFTYMMRPHPNWPVGDLDLPNGRIDDELSLEDSLLVADIVCVEASTVGLQAVLRGKPTICLHFSDYVIYPDYGWASSANSTDELKRIVRERKYAPPPPRVSHLVGGAAGRVVDLIISNSSL